MLLRNTRSKQSKPEPPKSPLKSTFVTRHHAVRKSRSREWKRKEGRSPMSGASSSSQRFIRCLRASGELQRAIRDCRVSCRRESLLLQLLIVHASHNSLSSSGRPPRQREHRATAAITSLACPVLFHIRCPRFPLPPDQTLYSLRALTLSCQRAGNRLIRCLHRIQELYV